MRIPTTGLPRILACGLLAALALPAQDDPDDQLGDLAARDWTRAPRYRVIRVVDGDSLIVSIDGQDERVQLIGVEAPESVRPNWPVEAYGPEAARFLDNLLRGEQVHLEFKPDEPRDKYGRILAFVCRAPDGLFVNLEAIRQGYARAYRRAQHPYLDLFCEVERRAEEARKGLWGAGGR